MSDLRLSRPLGALRLIWSHRKAEASHGREEAKTAGRDLSLVYVVFVSTLAGLAALYWSYRNGLLLIYDDSMSHLNIARRVLDSRTPGLAQLGTVWLPAPHVLLQPFVYSDFLWLSGLAGSIVGLLSFVITAAVLFQSVRLLVKHQAVAWLGLAVFLSNPNGLYLQTTALTEPVLMMAMTASGYFLLRWSKRASYRDLILTGLLGMVAVACRYDGWFFVATSAGLILIATYFGTRDERQSEGTTLAYLAIPTYAMFLWLFYNWLIFGDPLEFGRGQYSAAFQQAEQLQAGSLPTKGNLGLSFATYSWAVFDNLGALVVALGLAGIAVYVWRTRLRANTLMPYALLSPYCFNVLSLWLGQTIVVTRHSMPPYYFNVRYGILLLPAMALFVAYLADSLAGRLRLRFSVPAIALLLLTQMAFWLPGLPTAIVTVADGVEGRATRSEYIHDVTTTASYLREHYDGTGILIDEYGKPEFFYRVGLALREYVTTANADLWKNSLVNPAAHVGWVVMRSGNEDETDRVAQGIEKEALIRHFELALKEGNLAIYRRVE